MPPLPPQNSFSELLASGDYSDCILRCRGTEYRLHKAVVCPRSSFFEAAFKLELKEKRTGVIDLAEDDPELVGYMVYFLYHGYYNCRSKTQDGREDATLEQHALVYALAEKYGIPTLKSFASERFALSCLDSSETGDFAQVIKVVYCSTPAVDRTLRDIVVSTLILHHKLLDDAVGVRCGHGRACQDGWEAQSVVVRGRQLVNRGKGT